MKDFKVVAIEELLWSYHPLDPSWIVVPFSDKATLDSADVLVQSNQKGSKKTKPLGHMYEYIEQSRKPWIVTESAIFRKGCIAPHNPKAYHRYSWYSYYADEGDYCNKNSPKDRWLQIQKDQNIQINPWTKNGKYVLLVLQRPGDSSLYRMYEKYGTYDAYVDETIKEIKQYTNKPIMIRMHPLRQDKQKNLVKFWENYGEEDNVFFSTNSGKDVKDGLYIDFKDAWCVVGFNSNALTVSVCEGIPTFSQDPSSMAWECSNKDLKDIDNPKTFDRQQWLYDLSYGQWTEEEVSQGRMWDHLRKALK